MRLMRLKFPLPFRFGSNLSVKVRILSLSGLTAIGLLVIGGVFLWSQTRVELALERFDQTALLSRNIADLSVASGEMRYLEKGYLGAPDEIAFRSFNETLAGAYAGLEKLANQPLAKDFEAQVGDILATLDKTGETFALLDGIQQQIGYDPNTGIREILRSTAEGVKKRLKKEANFGGGPAFGKLLQALLEIQLSEKEFTLEQSDVSLGNFEVAFGRFERQLKRADIPADVKAEFANNMAKFRTAFDTYTIAVNERATTAERLENLFDVVPPYLASLSEEARTAEQEAKADLQFTRTLVMTVMGIVICGLLIGLTGLAILIGGSISGPLTRLQTAMEQLAGGKTDVELPAIRGKNEISAMTATVSVFRDNAIERLRLAAAQEEENANRNARVIRLEDLIAGFDRTVSEALGSLNRSTDELLQTSKAVDTASDDVSSQAGRAGEAVRVAAENVTTAASAAEELAASINEISVQAETSTKVAQKAVEGAGATFQTMKNLSTAATRIGEVMTLIRDIANQTNLLALNATIEAARAGEAGKGFAVVAAEVKQLAEQTSRATEDISLQIEAIQSSSENAVTSIEQVSSIITEMEALASAVAAAVVEQDAAVRSIAQSVTEASNRSEEGADRMGQVGTAADNVRSTGEEVETLAASLAKQGGVLRDEVSSFLESVRAA